jgi:hypothetical protein
LPGLTVSALSEHLSRYTPSIACAEAGHDDEVTITFCPPEGSSEPYLVKIETSHTAPVYYVLATINQADLSDATAIKFLGYVARAFSSQAETWVKNNLASASAAGVTTTINKVRLKIYGPKDTRYLEIGVPVYAPIE